MGLVAIAVCIFALPAIGRGAPIEYPAIAHILYPILFGIGATIVPFFIALYETMKLLNYIDTNTAFSALSVKALRRIKYCGVVMSALYTASVLPLFYTVAELDDAPGLVVIGMAITGAPIVVSVFAAVLQKLLQNAIDMKSENELTV
jgi:hypothetical protein